MPGGLIGYCFNRLAQIHNKEMIAKLILGNKKFVNTEKLQGLSCYECHEPIKDQRSFKCHKWTYATPQLLGVLEQMRTQS